MIFCNASKRILPFVLALSLCLTACGATQTPSPSPSAPLPSESVSPSPEPDPVAEQLAAMTTEQKVGQLLVAGVEGYTAGQDAQTAIRDLQVGGVILFKRNVASSDQLASLTNDLKALNNDHIPLFLCVDEEGGLVSRMPGEISDLPSAYTFGKIADPELRSTVCGELGTVLGDLCSAFGFNMNFAPVLDVWSNPNNTVIGKRAFSTDSQIAADCATQVAAAMEETGVIPVGKHFPGHGDTLTDSHVGLPVVNKTVEELEQLELLPFRTAIERDIPAIMVAHILMTKIDPERPASLSYPVVTELLREELGFDGLVCTDDLTMAAVSDSYGMGEAAVLAVEAGCDLLLVCHGADNLQETYDSLLQAVENGRIPMERLDESVSRILRLKLTLPSTNAPTPPPQVEALNEMIAELLKKMDR